MRFPIYLSLFLILLGLSSCEKLNLFDDDKEEACFDLTFPLNYNMPDGTTITANDEITLDAAMENWYTANPNSKDEASLQFPVSAVFADGSTQSITNEKGLKNTYSDCDDEKQNICEIEFVYPLSFLLPDGSTLIVVDEQDEETQLGNWYSANPNASTKPALQYPVDITLDDGTV